MKNVIKFIKAKSTSRLLLKEERKAARFIVKQYEADISFLGLPENVLATKSAYEIIGRRKTGALSKEDWKKLDPFFPSLYNQSIVREKLKELKYQAWAFRFFIAKITPQEAARLMGKRGWKLLHGVTVRLAWMIRQRHFILKGSQFNHPFLCFVGGHINRRNMDREFYSIMTFVSLFSKRRKLKYLFDSVPNDSVPSLPRPDFIIKDQFGNRLGIEVTEANMSKGSHFDDESLEIFQKALRKIFEKKMFTVSLHSNPKWEIVRAELEQVLIWVKGEAKNAEKAFKSKETFSASNLQYGIVLKFQNGNGPYLFFDSGKEIIGVQPEINLGKGIRDRIEAKLKIDKSEIRPCYLVIFMREGVPFMNTKVVRANARRGLGKGFLSHYDQIWAVKGGRLFKIA